MTLTSKTFQAQVAIHKMVRFTDFGVEIRYPGGKVRDIGADFRIIAMLKEEAGKKTKRLVDPGKIWEAPQSLVRTWEELPKAFNWIAPTKDEYNKNYEHTKDEHLYSIVLCRHLLRNSGLSDNTVIAQIRGVWNFTRVYS